MRTDADIKREDKADVINKKLIGTGVKVVAGGKHGPYTVMIDELNEKEMKKIVQILLKEFKFDMRI